ncbi:MAG: beta-ketoacyl-[acyl-carrier-protein] synthase family protein [Candidatus Omnitrophica bacterium]|nr:beta-ketoacyl-[acyl-carrier-protein] synthase family protein [Candidatus Omnitrophota bacterium]
MKKNKRQIVITGLGAVTPMDCGAGVEAFWQGLCQGRNTIKPLKLIGVKDYCCQFGGEAAGFEKFLKEKPIKSQGRCSELFYHALEQALDDANCRRHIPKAGMAFGTILGEIGSGQKYIQKLMAQGKKDIALLRNYSLNSSMAYFASKLKLSGPCFCVNTTCSSSGDAIGLALREIEHSRADIMIAGGADMMSDMLAVAFAGTEAAAKDGVVRPFDKNRKGFCISEGASVVILEELNHAKTRGAKIYCQLSGYGSTSDACHPFSPDKDGKGLSRAIEEALKDSGSSFDSIDYINAHGIGTVYNDLSETRAIKRSFGGHSKKLKISSIKSMIGHTMGASMGLDVIATAKTLCEGIIPPTINYKTPDPDCDLDYVPNKAIHQKVRRAMCLSAGLGGQNCAIVVEKISP